MVQDLTDSQISFSYKQDLKHSNICFQDVTIIIHDLKDSKILIAQDVP